MLTIRADTWHLRLWRWAHESKTATPKNLCRYFWFLFLLITIPILAGIGVLIGTALLIWVMITHWETSAIVVAVVLVFVALIAASIYREKNARERREEEKERLKAAGQWPPPAKKRKEPSIFMAWLRAKKQKVCPLIAVEEVDR